MSVVPCTWISGQPSEHTRGSEDNTIHTIHTSSFQHLAKADMVLFSTVWTISASTRLTGPNAPTAVA